MFELFSPPNWLNWQIKQGKTTVSGFGCVKICFKDKNYAQIITFHDNETKTEYS